MLSINATTSSEAYKKFLKVKQLPRKKYFKPNAHSYPTYLRFLIPYQIPKVTSVCTTKLASQTQNSKISSLAHLSGKEHTLK
jgi:hypothetical protein